MAQNDLEKNTKGCPPAGKAQTGKVFKFRKKVEIHFHPDYAPERTADNISVGETLVWGRDGMWRFRVIRSTGSFCGYVGLPTWHPLAWFHYDRIGLDPHGGFTFGGFLDPDHRKIKWYGWDYAHLWDRLVLGPAVMKELKKSPGWPESFPSFTVDGHNWTLIEVLGETVQIATEFRERTWALLIKAIQNVIADYFFGIRDLISKVFEAYVSPFCWVVRQINKKILKRKKQGEGSMKR